MSIEDRGVTIEDRGVTIDRGSRCVDRGSRCDDRSRIAVRVSIKDRGVTIEDRGVSQLYTAIDFLSITAFHSKLPIHVHTFEVLYEILLPFEVPLGYLRTTAIVPSKYYIGTFEIPLQYLKSTARVLSKYRTGTLQVPLSTVPLPYRYRTVTVPYRYFC